MPGAEHSSQTQEFLVKQTQGFSTAGWRQCPNATLFTTTYRWWRGLGFLSLTFHEKCMLFTSQHPLLEKQPNEEAIVGMKLWAWKMLFPRRKGMVKASPWVPGSEITCCTCCTCCWDQRQSSCHCLLGEQRSLVSTLCHRGYSHQLSELTTTCV